MKKEVAQKLKKIYSVNFSFNLFLWTSIELFCHWHKNFINNRENLKFLQFHSKAILCKCSLWHIECNFVEKAESFSVKTNTLQLKVPNWWRKNNCATTTLSKCFSSAHVECSFTTLDYLFCHNQRIAKNHTKSQKGRKQNNFLNHFFSRCCSGQMKCLFGELAKSFSS